MSNDLSTINLQTELPGVEVSTSDAWSKSFFKRPDAPWLRFVQVGGMLLSIAASPATAVPDYWFFERRRDAAPTVTSVGASAARGGARRRLHHAGG